MLSVSQISKSFDLQLILKEVSFTLNAGERIGLVGPNGCGKTTLLRILTGEERADGGSVRFTRPGLRLGYLPQGSAFAPGETVGAYLARSGGDPAALAGKLAELSERLVSEPERTDLQSDFDALLERLSDAPAAAGRSADVLAGLGLAGLPSGMPASHLSGGQKTRLALAGVLLSDPHLLLLDEPTNHLDFDMLSWMEDWLIGFKGGALVVSHDRVFLDRAATAILEIDPMTHTARMFAGSYSAYLETKAAERERQWQDFRDQQDEIIRLRAAAARVRSRAKFHAGGKADPAMTDGLSAGFFANRGKETVARAKSIEKRVEHLLTDERVEKPGRTWQMKVEFAGAPSGRDVLAAENLSVGYGEHVLLSGLDLNLRLGERAALVGPNGSGKTTLLRTIAGELPPLTGRLRLGAGVQTGYMAQEQETFDPALNVLDTLSAVAPQNETTMRTFLSKYLFTGDEVFVPVGRLSFGERARLSLACLVAQGCNLLLLDEPLNHLDIPARTRFEHALSSFQGTVLVVAHDRYFIAAFARTQWEVRGGRVFADPA